MIVVDDVQWLGEPSAAPLAFALRRDQIWGDRSGTITDPFGQVWLISTHIEDLTTDEIAERVGAAN